MYMLKAGKPIYTKDEEDIYRISNVMMNIVKVKINICHIYDKLLSVGDFPKSLFCKRNGKMKRILIDFEMLFAREKKRTEDMANKFFEENK